MTYTQHPLSAAFPAMSAEDLDALTQDIAAHGQREPGMLYEGQVLDGWHRYQACEGAGVEFVAVEYTGDDPVAFVISRNAHRRHLTASQRAAAVVMCAEWKPAHRPANNPELGSGLSEADMAKAAQTSDRTIRDAKAAVRAGLGEAVRDGQMSAKAAVAVAKGEEPKRKWEFPGEPETRNRPAPAAAPEPDEDDLLESMRRRIGQLNDQLAALAQDDVQAELRKQMALRVAIEERLSDTMNTNARLNSELRAFGKWQMDLFRATGVETRAEVLRMARAWRGSQEEAA